MKPLRIFYPGDQIWFRNYRRSEKWIKGTVISKVGTVMYKVKCCNEIYEKHIDQLRFCPDIETESEVKDASQLEQNLSLHTIHHSIEPDQSNQTIMSPPLNNALSDNPTNASSPESPDTLVPNEPNIDKSTQQSDTSPFITRDRQK